MSNIEYGNVSQQQEHQKERDSNSTIAPEGDCPEFQESLKILTRSFLDQRLSMFYGEQRSPDISSKLIQKAISWIQVTGYIKNLDFQTIILAIGLFYACFYNLQPTKKQIESILCACIWLACKLSSKIKFSLADVLKLINDRQTPESILDKQQKILTMLDFNLFFNFPVMQILQNLKLTEQQSYKIQFLTEILLLKQSKILYTLQQVQEIVQLSSKTKLTNDSYLTKKLSKLLKKTLCEHLLNKYKSKFNVNSYIELIITSDKNNDRNSTTLVEKTDVYIL